MQSVEKGSLPMRATCLESLCLTTLSVITVACVSPGQSGLSYREPTAIEKVKNEELMSRSFDETWDLLIRELTKSFFVFHTVEKASRLISLSFTTDKAHEYVDCGNVERRLRYRDEVGTYTYPAASSSSYKYAGAWGSGMDLPLRVSALRRTALEGKINIYVAPHDQQTLVAVNTRYLLTIHTVGLNEHLNSSGKVVKAETFAADPLTVTFNTGQTGMAEEAIHGTTAMKCRSNGKLEADILRMPRRPNLF